MLAATPADPACAGDMFTRDVDCAVTGAEVLTEQMCEWASTLGVPQGVLSVVALVFDELYTNIAMHGYAHRGGPVTVQVRVDAQAAELVVTLVDEAGPFDPTQAPEADTSLGIEEREIGGLGLLFVRRKADALSYRRSPGPPARNEVTFRKRFH